MLQALGVVLALPVTLVGLIYIGIVKMSVYVWGEFCEMHLNDIQDVIRKIIQEQRTRINKSGR